MKRRQLKNPATTFNNLMSDMDYIMTLFNKELETVPLAVDVAETWAKCIKIYGNHRAELEKMAVLPTHKIYTRVLNDMMSK